MRAFSFMARELVNFGRSRIAFATRADGKLVLVSYRKVRKVPSERTWKELERKLTPTAPEAQ